MDLVVTAFIGLHSDMKAYIFRTINSEQRKINPSLVYDLVPELRSEWVDFEDARATTIVRHLNEAKDSPWYDGIDMYGHRERSITQASFVTRIKSLFKKGGIFENVPENEFYEENIQIGLLVEYFLAVSATFSKAWKNQNYILCKNSGVGAMLNLLKYIVDDLKRTGKHLTDDTGLVLRASDFTPYVEKLQQFSFRSEQYGSTYLGEAGIRELTSNFRTILKV